MYSIQHIQTEFKALTALFTDRLAGVFDDEDEKIFHGMFHNFMDSLETNYAGVLDDDAAYKQMIEDVPGIEPFWKLLKELRLHDPKMFDTVDKDYQVTQRQVDELMSSKETAEFIRHKLDIKIDDIPLLSGFEDASKNVKVLRLAQFIGYAASGKATALLNSLPSEMDKNQRYQAMYHDFQKSIEFLTINKKGVRFKDDGVYKHQPGPYTTDSVVMSADRLHAYIIFATANNNFMSQNRQIFDYPYKTKAEHNNLDPRVAAIEKITSIMVGAPLIEINALKPFGGMFNRSTFTPNEVELINTVPFLSLLNNVDNSQTEEFLDIMMNTEYYSVGGGSSNWLKKSMPQFGQIDPPERQKKMLEAFASRLFQVAVVLDKKTMEQKRDVLNVKNVGKDGHSLMIGVTRAIKGLVKQAAFFKDDPTFIDSIQETLSKCQRRFHTFASHIDPRNIAPVDTIDEFKDRIDALNPTSLKIELQQKEITPIYKDKSSLTVDGAKEVLNTYLSDFVQPIVEQLYEGKRGRSLDIMTHFARILEQKVEQGQLPSFSQANVEGSYHFILKYLKPDSSLYNNQGELNTRLQEVFDVILSNHTNEDFLYEMDQLRTLRERNLSIGYGAA